MTRQAKITRKTAETDIELELNLDGTGYAQIATGVGIKIAVIDSQIDVKNPELAGDIAGEFDAVGAAEPPDVHGTEMAGVIAAHDRLTGVAPKAEIYAIHAFSRSGDSFGSSTFNIVNALNWAIGQNVRVINMSFTGPRDPSIDRALQIGHDPGTSRRLKLNGLRSDVSWRGPAQRYAALYRALARPAE